ncbi:MAG: hypothetical protein KGJ19_08935 [Betaproteobacteria bacterium]|nr:hypothetical protein [Betaproteobacteria bacterium]MDE2309625.1 hypothetical protein [Betaproteobacteria bacterium]
MSIRFLGVVAINVNQPGNGSWPFAALDTILNVPESRGIYFHLTGVSMPDGNIHEQPDAQAASKNYLMPPWRLTTQEE